jgi:uncharacterized protein (TIGR03435 family)
MRGDDHERLSAWKKALLTTAGVVSVVAPIGTGTINGETLRAQAPTIDPGGRSFAVASVKPNKSGQRATSLGFQSSGRFRAVNEPLWRLIAEAYRTTYQLRRFEIIGVPDEIAGDRFDIEAVPEGKPSPEQRQTMLQTLLADRFKLVVHRETRQLPTYNLVKARSDGRLGEQLRPSNIDCAALRAAGALPVPVQPGQERPCVMMFGESVLRATGMTMADLADMALSRNVERKVVDQTGLKGGFEWTLEWGSESAPGDLQGVSVFTALQEQPGLELESATGSVDVLVIDSVAPPTPD